VGYLGLPLGVMLASGDISGEEFANFLNAVWQTYKQPPAG